MNERPTGTRERILAAAEQLFVERGYHATTLQQVADRVGITKPALYYHFASKADVLGNLLDPMIAELERVLADADAAGGPGGATAVRTVLISGWTDVFLRSRGTLLALFRELTAMPADTFDRLLSVMDRAIETAAGPDATVGERVAVAQAVSAITDPIALLPYLPDDLLREHLLAGAWRLLDQPAGPARRPRGGRPRAVAADDVARARELHASGEHTAESIAAELGVSRATVYRYLKTKS
ncbi:MAG: TetR family transcriptional regulator [Actinophytocola sp.]|uniref:TetR family transcriptional regulator n=1 Tax=Actinophytocola sp. TaxID=1872138 RepID=UPI00132B020F|nr:TetR family transcriptional regulator [Actinophytocola sp.]MPZ80833.1 TetR family transcriptional regulator [Actinophytocola sp.]